MLFRWRYSVIDKTKLFEKPVGICQPAEIRSRRTKKGLRPGEYLYGFRKSSRLCGAVTFAIYYGEEEWDGSKDLCGHLEEDAYDVIAQYAKAPELLEQKENSTGKDGKVDMCRALKELIANGEATGEARGEVRMNERFANLIRENRFDDMKKVVSDSEYRRKLLAEYHIAGAVR